MSTQLAFLGRDTRFGNDKIGRFSSRRLARGMRKIIPHKSAILTLGDNNIGRIVSRWGKNHQYGPEVAKSLGMILLLTHASSSIYYGDELGMLNIGLNHLDNFQDVSLLARKRKAQAEGLSEISFMAAQVLQNPINARSLMAWNESKNGGFSDAEKTITPPSISYPEINVETQFHDYNSPLHFYRQLKSLLTNSLHYQVITKGKISIISYFGIIRLKLTYRSQKMLIFVNLSEWKKIIINKSSNAVLLSTHSHKIYSKSPWILDGFESLVVINYKSQLVNSKKLNDQVEANNFTRDFEKKLQKSKRSSANDLDQFIYPQEILKPKATDDIELKTEKTKALAEMKAARKMAQDNHKFEIMEDEILESDRTTLTEEEIAPTTQINTSDVDDLEDFIKHETKNKKQS